MTKTDKVIKLIKKAEEDKFTGEIILYFHKGDLSNKVGQKKMMHILDVHRLDHEGINNNTELLTV